MECRFAQFGMKLVAAAREYHPGELGGSRNSYPHF